LDQQGCLLAEIPNFGRVFDCGECGNIHLTVGPFGVTLAPDAYVNLVALLNASASNFETWLHERRKERASDRVEGGSSSESRGDSV
jgi:hypothetical protein